jgi:hypothetical protein
MGRPRSVYAPPPPQPGYGPYGQGPAYGYPQQQYTSAGRYRERGPRGRRYSGDESESSRGGSRSRRPSQGTDSDADEVDDDEVLEMAQTRRLPKDDKTDRRDSVRCVRGVGRCGCGGQCGCLVWSAGRDP